MHVIGGERCSSGAEAKLGLIYKQKFVFSIVFFPVILFSLFSNQILFPTLSITILSTYLK